MKNTETSFNPAEAEDGFRRWKSKKSDCSNNSFNPAEAEDGFRRKFAASVLLEQRVSIQPKPKTGLEELPVLVSLPIVKVSIQPKPKTGLEVQVS